MTENVFHFPSWASPQAAFALFYCSCTASKEDGGNTVSVTWWHLSYLHHYFLINLSEMCIICFFPHLIFKCKSEYYVYNMLIMLHSSTVLIFQQLLSTSARSWIRLGRRQTGVQAVIHITILKKYILKKRKCVLPGIILPMLPVQATKMRGSVIKIAISYYLDYFCLCNYTVLGRLKVITTITRTTTVNVAGVKILPVCKRSLQNTEIWKQTKTPLHIGLKLSKGLTNPTPVWILITKLYCSIPSTLLRYACGHSNLAHINLFSWWCIQLQEFKTMHLKCLL